MAERVVVAADDDRLGLTVVARPVEPVAGHRRLIADARAYHQRAGRVGEHLLHRVGADREAEGIEQGPIHLCLRAGHQPIDIVGAHDGAGKKLEQVVLLVGVVGRGEGCETVALVLPEPLGDQIERLVQRSGDQLVALPHRGGLQPVGMLHLLVAPLAADAGVAVVDAPLPEMGDAPHQTAVVLDVQRAAHVAEAADGLGGVQLPGMMGELAIGQRPDRADRDAHTAGGAGGVAQVHAVGRADLGLQPAVEHLDRGDADHLVADAGAAGADDAALPLVVDEVAEVFVGPGDLRSPVGVGVDVVVVGVVLQVALTRLVAGGAVERVVDQVHLQDELARLFAGRRVGRDLHTVPHLRGAGFDQAAAPAEDLDRADPAGAPGAQQRLVAEVGHLDADHPAGLEDGHPFGYRVLLPVDRDGDQSCWALHSHETVILSTVARAVPVIPPPRTTRLEGTWLAPRGVSAPRARLGRACTIVPSPLS
ncbi:hypothetical protein HRbin26_01836 [bacterium HR26]|nr:hypothetical protein HRbin26_01836 [bacterium HR26]